MMNQEIDLTICQDCKEQPATYGDGVTWSRCSQCQLKQAKAEGKVEVQEPVGNNESFPHIIEKDVVSVIIPVHMKNYTLFHYTGNCIGSVREHLRGDEGVEIVIVDNGSPIKPPKNEAYYAHKVIVNEENLGVTKAWNQGIRMSVGEYIVLLNNDVQVFDGWLTDMKKAIDEDGYDLVMAHPMYSMTEPFARAPEARKVRVKLIGSDKKYSDFRDFSCVMFKRSLIDEIGLFDEAFFSYCSDSDFIRRIEETGKKWACVESVATSHISDATGIYLKESPQILEKDKETFKKKWENKPIPSKANLIPGTDLVRVVNGGDPIYLIVDKMIHPIKNPETLKALGFDFGQEKNISKEEFGKYLKGGMISMENVEEYKVYEDA